MIVTLILLFMVGYLCIALEHTLRIDKTAIALLLGMVMWIVYALGAEWIVPLVDNEDLARFVSENPRLAGSSPTSVLTMC